MGVWMPKSLNLGGGGGLGVGGESGCGSLWSTNYSLDIEGIECGDITPWL